MHAQLLTAEAGKKNQGIRSLDYSGSAICLRSLLIGDYFSVKNG
jgi:hypothetical protein